MKLSDNELRELIESLPPEEQKLWQELSDIERSALAAALMDHEVGEVLHSRDWAETPVTPNEFFTDPHFIGNVCWNEKTKTGLYPKWREELEYVLNPDNGIVEWILSGSLGAGKSLAAVLSGVYLLYKLSCLRNPHEYLGILADTPIEFLIMNVSLVAAQDTAMAYWESFLSGSPYFRSRFPQNRRKRTRVKMNNNSRNDKDRGEYALELPPSFNIVEGSGSAHSIGRNIIWGMLDEANFLQRSGKDASRYSYGPLNRAYALYTGLINRVESRFMSQQTTSGLVILISSAASEHDFLEQHKKRSRENPKTHISEFSRWEVSRWKYSSETFRVFVGGRTANSRVLRDDEAPPTALGKVIDVPLDFRPSFERDLSLALREVAGIPSDVVNPLIPVKEQIAETVDDTRKHPFTQESPVVGHMSATTVMDFFIPLEVAVWEGKRLVPKYHRGKERFIHVDLGLTNDAAAVSMGCVYDVSYSIVADHENRSTLAPVPNVWIDFMLRLSPPAPPEQVGIAKIRQFIKYLRDVLNFNITKVTFDGFASEESVQLLQVMGFNCEVLSVDKKPQPYKALRGAIMEKRILRYAYEPFEVEVAQLQVEENTGKCDHPPGGSKDISDTVAGVTWHCVEEVLREGNSKYQTAAQVVKGPALPSRPGAYGSPDWKTAVGDDYSL